MSAQVKITIRRPSLINGGHLSSRKPFGTDADMAPCVPKSIPRRLTPFGTTADVPSRDPSPSHQNRPTPTYEPSPPPRALNAKRVMIPLIQ